LVLVRRTLGLRRALHLYRIDLSLGIPVVKQDPPGYFEVSVRNGAFGGLSRGDGPAPRGADRGPGEPGAWRVDTEADQNPSVAHRRKRLRLRTGASHGYRRGRGKAVWAPLKVLEI